MVLLYPFRWFRTLRRRALPAAERFGRPHAHSGLGSRKLGNTLFECRARLALRLIFQDRPTDIFVSFLGDHDEIKASLRSGKYR